MVFTVFLGVGAVGVGFFGNLSPLPTVARGESPGKEIWGKGVGMREGDGEEEEEEEEGEHCGESRRRFLWLCGWGKEVCEEESNEEERKKESIRVKLQRKRKRAHFRTPYFSTSNVRPTFSTHFSLPLYQRYE